MIMIFRCRVSDNKNSTGVALIIVLAFVVLLSGLVVAYFARTTVDRQLARSSFDNTAADILARSALDIVVGDLKQEIVTGSIGPAGAYVLANDVYIVPMRSGNSTDIPNLIRRSIRNDSITSPPGVQSRASVLNSTDDISANGRFVSLARWNRHYLIPRLNPSSATVDATPTGSFIAPDWVLVNNLGPSILTAPSASVLGRYAYAVYDEGGLLDMNVAGFPSTNSTDSTYLGNIGKKGVLAFADLTSTGLSSGAIDNMIGWRNYSTGQPTGAYNDPNASFSFPSNPSSFVAYFLSTSRNFGIPAVPIPSPTPAASPYPTPANVARDQSFINRNTLLEIRRTLQATQNAMQYFGTFSRELNKSTWSDSATKLAGRFPLRRFNWFLNPLANAADIRKYFGLQYVPADPNAFPPTLEHWQYVGTSGTTLLSTIPSISGNNQDPDLFPLLQYALPSAGVSELLSIGASLIDQLDANDDTTWIEFGNPSVQKAFGVDNNPSTEPGAPPQPANVVVLNRSFRNVGELGYAYRNGSTSLDFQTAGSSDRPLLDLFTYNTASPRSGIVNLNTQNPGVIAAIIKRAFATKASSSGVDLNTANDAANKIITDTTNGTAVNPAVGRQDIARLAEAGGAVIGADEEAKETIARALAEVTQTRTWNLLIDVIAQSGRYGPNAASGPSTTNPLANFIVEGEKRYWLHVAIDRFTGEIIDRQLEAVYE